MNKLEAAEKVLTFIYLIFIINQPKTLQRQNNKTILQHLRVFFG